MASNYNNKYNTVSDDEIDLGRIFIKFILILRRRYIILLITATLGLILGIYFYVVQQSVFESRMTVSSTLLNANNTSNLIETIDLLLNEGNHDLVSQKFQIPVDQVRKLAGLSVEKGTEGVQDQTPNIFHIEAQVTDNNILGPLQNGITYYLENTDFVKRRVDLKKETINALREKLKAEIQDLEALKARVNNNFMTGNEGTNTVIMDPASIYKQAITMYESELDLQTQLAFVENVQVIDGFTVFNKRISPRIRHIGYWLFGGLLLGIMLVFVFEIIDYSRKVEISEYA
ncbi:hypothetical protein BH23BAC1_BH23BAC1_00660 [soil metagenome]